MNFHLKIKGFSVYSGYSGFSMIYTSSESESSFPSNLFKISFILSTLLEIYYFLSSFSLFFSFYNSYLFYYSVSSTTDYRYPCYSLFITSFKLIF